MALLERPCGIRQTTDKPGDINMHYYLPAHPAVGPRTPSPPPLPPTPPPPPPLPTSSPPPSPTPPDCPPIVSTGACNVPRIGKDPRSKTLKRYCEDKLVNHQSCQRVPWSYQETRCEFKDRWAYNDNRPYPYYNRPGLGYRQKRMSCRSESYWNPREPEWTDVNGGSKSQKPLTSWSVNENNRQQAHNGQHQSTVDQKGIRATEDPRLQNRRDTDADRGHHCRSKSLTGSNWREARAQLPIDPRSAKNPKREDFTDDTKFYQTSPCRKHGKEISKEGPDRPARHGSNAAKDSRETADTNARRSKCGIGPSRITNVEDDDSDHNIQDMEVTFSDDEFTNKIEVHRSGEPIRKIFGNASPEEIQTAAKHSRNNSDSSKLQEDHVKHDQEGVLDNGLGGLGDEPGRHGHKYEPVNDRQENKDNRCGNDSKRDTRVVRKHARVAKLQDKRLVPGDDSHTEANVMQLSKSAKDRREVADNRLKLDYEVGSEKHNRKVEKRDTWPTSDFTIHCYQTTTPRLANVNIQKSTVEKDKRNEEEDRGHTCREHVQWPTANRAKDVKSAMISERLCSPKSSSDRSSSAKSSSARVLNSSSRPVEPIAEEVEKSGKNPEGASSLKKFFKKDARQDIGNEERKSGIHNRMLPKTADSRSAVEDLKEGPGTRSSEESLRHSDRTFKNHMDMKGQFFNRVFNREDDTTSLEEGEIREDSDSGYSLDLTRIIQKSPEDQSPKTVENDFLAAEKQTDNINHNLESVVPRHHSEHRDSLFVVSDNAEMVREESDTCWDTDSVFVDDQSSPGEDNKVKGTELTDSLKENNGQISDVNDSETDSSSSIQQYYLDISEDESREETKSKESNSEDSDMSTDLNIPEPNSQELADKEVAFHVEDCELEPSSAEILNEFLKFVDTTEATSEGEDNQEKLFKDFDIPTDVLSSSSVNAVERKAEWSEKDDNSESDMEFNTKKNRKRVSCRDSSEDIEHSKNNKPKRPRTKQYQLRSKARKPIVPGYGLRSKQQNSCVKTEEDHKTHCIADEDTDVLNETSVFLDSQLKAEFNNPVPLEYRKRRKDLEKKQEEHRNLVDTSDSVMMHPMIQEAVEAKMAEQEIPRTKDVPKISDAVLTNKSAEPIKPKTPEIHQITSVSTSPSTTLEVQVVSGTTKPKSSDGVDTSAEQPKIPEVVEVATIQSPIAACQTSPSTKLLPKTPEITQMVSRSTTAQSLIPEAAKMTISPSKMISESAQLATTTMSETIKLAVSTPELQPAIPERLLTTVQNAAVCQTSSCSTTALSKIPETTHIPVNAISDFWSITNGSSMELSKSQEASQLTASSTEVQPKNAEAIQMTSDAASIYARFSEGGQSKISEAIPLVTATAKMHPNFTGCIQPTPVQPMVPTYQMTSYSTTPPSQKNSGTIQNDISPTSAMPKISEATLMTTDTSVQSMISAKTLLKIPRASQTSQSTRMSKIQETIPFKPKIQKIMRMTNSPTRTQSRQTTNGSSKLLSKTSETIQMTINPEKAQQSISPATQMATATAQMRPMQLTTATSTAQQTWQRTSDLSTVMSRMPEELSKSPSAVQSKLQGSENQNKYTANVMDKTKHVDGSTVHHYPPESASSRNPPSRGDISRSASLPVAREEAIPNSAQASVGPKPANASAEDFSTMSRRGTQESDDEIFFVKECPGNARTTNISRSVQHQNTKYHKVKVPQCPNMPGHPIVSPPQRNQRYITVAPPCNDRNSVSSNLRLPMRQPANEYPCPNVSLPRQLVKAHIPTAPPPLMPISTLSKRLLVSGPRSNGPPPDGPAVRNPMPGPLRLTATPAQRPPSVVTAARYNPAMTAYYLQQNNPRSCAPPANCYRQSMAGPPQLVPNSFYRPTTEVGRSNCEIPSISAVPTRRNESAWLPVMQQHCQERITATDTKKSGSLPMNVEPKAAALQTRRTAPMECQARDIGARPGADNEQRIKARGAPTSAPLDLTSKAKNTAILCQLLQTNKHAHQQPSTDRISPNSSRDKLMRSASQSQVETQEPRIPTSAAWRNQATQPQTSAQACDYTKYFDISHLAGSVPHDHHPLWHHPSTATNQIPQSSVRDIPEDLRSKHPPLSMQIAETEECRSSRLRELLRTSDNAARQQASFQNASEIRMRSKSLVHTDSGCRPSAVDLRRASEPLHLSDPTSNLYESNHARQEPMPHHAFHLSGQAAKQQQHPDGRLEATRYDSSWKAAAGGPFGFRDRPAEVGEPRWCHSEPPDGDKSRRYTENSFLDHSFFIMPSATDVTRPNCGANGARGVVYPTPIRLSSSGLPRSETGISENNVHYAYNMAQFQQVLKMSGQLGFPIGQTGGHRVLRPVPPLTQIRSSAPSEPKESAQPPYFHDSTLRLPQQASPATKSLPPSTGIMTGIPHRIFQPESRHATSETNATAYKGTILAMPNKPVPMRIQTGQPQYSGAQANDLPMQVPPNYFKNAKLPTHPAQYCNMPADASRPPAATIAYADSQARLSLSKPCLPETTSVRAQIWHPFHSPS